jgi:hypothetical protein
MQFYLDAGVPDNELVSTFDKRYIGGAGSRGIRRKTELHQQRRIPQPLPRPNGQKSKLPGATRKLMTTAISTTRRYQSLSWVNGCPISANQMPIS